MKPEVEVIWAACVTGSIPVVMAGRALRRRVDTARKHRAEEHIRLTDWLPDLRPILRPQLALAGENVGVGRHRLRAQGLTNRHHRG